MTNDNEQHGYAGGTFDSRDTHLGSALKFGLAHVDAPAGMGAILGALATLRKDPIDDEAFEMAESAIFALVCRSPQEREAAHRWHAQRQGYPPDKDAIAILDLERQVKLARRFYCGTSHRSGSR